MKHTKSCILMFIIISFPGAWLNGDEARGHGENRDEIHHVENEVNHGMLQQLVSMLEGEYDSLLQAQADNGNKVPDEQKHFQVNRTFRRVTAPEVGQYVLVSTTSYFFKKWVFDANEFMVWSVTLSEQGGSVLMSPTRYKEFEQRLPFAFDPEKLSGFGKGDLEPAVGGGACTIEWRRSENGFVGQSQPCRVHSVTKDMMLDWSWQFDLTPRALWVSFSGKDASGKTRDGTPEGLPYRLDRL